MIDSSFSYLGIEYEEAVIWVASLLCDAIVPLFAHFSVLLHAFWGIIENYVYVSTTCHHHRMFGCG